MVANYFEDHNPWFDPICKRSESKSTVKNGKKWKTKTASDK